LDSKKLWLVAEFESTAVKAVPPVTSTGVVVPKNISAVVFSSVFHITFALVEATFADVSPEITGSVVDDVDDKVVNEPWVEVAMLPFWSVDETT
jgi:hypothetical protein